MREALSRVEQALGEVQCFADWALSDDDLIGSLDQVSTLRCVLDRVELGLVRQLDSRGLAKKQGATNTKMWLAGRYHISPAAAERLVKLAGVLLGAPSQVGAGAGLGQGGLAATAAALAGGAINQEQAKAIADAVVKLPGELWVRGEEHLLEAAKVFGPGDLGRLAQRLLEVIDPERAERDELAALEKAEKEAYGKRGLKLTDLAGGSQVKISGLLDREGAAHIRAALDPLCAPGHPHARGAAASTHSSAAGGGDGTRRDAGDSGTGSGAGGGFAGQPAGGLGGVGAGGGPGSEPGGFGGGTGSGFAAEPDSGLGEGGSGEDQRTPAQRHADALVELCRHSMACGDLPENGGDRPQVVVTINYDTLCGELGEATLDDGSPLSPQAARRMACDARILPAVLGGAGQVLDLGRIRRLFTGSIRRALVIRDRGCAFPGCDRPPQWTDGHHILGWMYGGTTDLNNGVLLCMYHHRTIHHSEWTVSINPTDGLPDFYPPSFVDPQRLPRRNTYHRRQ